MSDLITSRRSFLTGLGAVLVAAPAIVRAGSLMPVKAMELELDFDWRMPPGTYMASPSDLAAVVRRAFVPRLFVQVYKSDPLMRAVFESDPDWQAKIGLAS